MHSQVTSRAQPVKTQRTAAGRRPTCGRTSRAASLKVMLARCEAPAAVPAAFSVAVVKISGDSAPLSMTCGPGSRSCRCVSMGLWSLHDPDAHAHGSPHSPYQLMQQRS